MKFLNLKKPAIGLALVCSIGALAISSCGSEGTVTEEVVVPTEGLITTVKEVELDLFKIEDEQVVKDTADSRIIANYLDHTSDTFTLAEARLIEANDPDGRRRSVVRSAGMGFLGYMFFRNMMGGRPGVGAYTNSAAHSRVANGAGSRMEKSAARATRTRPAGSRKGYGSGRSTRSYGG